MGVQSFHDKAKLGAHPDTGDIPIKKVQGGYKGLCRAEKIAENEARAAAAVA